MAANDYGIYEVPNLVKSMGVPYGERATLTVVAKSSTTVYWGQFVAIMNGTQAAPTGIEFGTTSATAGKPIFGVVVGIHKTAGSSYSLADDATRSGTYTAATTITSSTSGNRYIPWKYQFAATNDEASTTSAIKEVMEVLPIYSGDIFEISLVNSGGTSFINRGTTTAAGTTGSSDNLHIGFSINSTLPFALTESSAAKALAGLDFISIDVDGRKPSVPYHVFAQALIAQEGFENTF